MDNEIALASSNIKDANLKTLARMVVDNDAAVNDPNIMNIGLVKLAKLQDDYVAMIEFAKSILKDTE